VCHGKRYNRETLEVQFKGKSIADVLDMTVEEGAQFFSAVPAVRDKLATLEDRSRFTGWLSRIVYHLAVDRLRKRSSAPGPHLEGMDFRDPTWESPGAVLERREKLQQVRQAVSSLDEIYLLPITLRYYSGLSLAEVAHQLDIPLGTVKARLHRGVKKLRFKLNSPLKVGAIYTIGPYLFPHLLPQLRHAPRAAT